MSTTTTTELTPQQISASFVAQYYTTLTSNIKNLYKFYKDESEMTHEHAEIAQLQGGENPNTVVGMKNIEQQINKLNYEECKVRLTFVDSQHSINGSVFVFVEGIMSRQSESPNKFIQTFILAEQENGYYVRNDYLRFTGLYTQSTSSMNQSNTQTYQSSSSPSPINTSTTSSTNNTQPTSLNQVSFQNNNHGIPSPRSETSSTAATVGASSVVALDEHVNEETFDEEEEQQQTKPIVEEKKEVNHVPISKPKQDKKQQQHVEPISYAAAVGGKEYKQPEDKTTSTANATSSVNAHQQHKRNKPNKQQQGSSPSKDNNNTTTANNVEEGKDKKGFRGKDHPQNKYALYVRDLPNATKDSDLKKAFVGFGNIIDINNKSAKDQSFNRYALIFFEDKKSVDEALEKSQTVNVKGAECPIARYSRKPKTTFTGNSNNRGGSTSRGTGPRGNGPLNRQRFTRTTNNNNTTNNTDGAERK